MSTRAQIIVKDQWDELIFYRHSDGYPDGALPLLKKFLDLVKKKQIRDNVEQASGWLIVLGRAEYAEMIEKFKPDCREKWNDPNSMGWKVGAIEPAACIHDDIEYLYVIDLEKKTLKHKKVNGTDVPEKFYSGKYHPKNRPEALVA